MRLTQSHSALQSHLNKEVTLQLPTDLSIWHSWILQRWWKSIPDSCHRAM